MGPAEPGVWVRAGFPICSSVQTNLECMETALGTKMGPKSQISHTDLFFF